MTSQALRIKLVALRIVIGTGLATGLQGYRYGSELLTLTKPIPAQTRTCTRGVGMVNSVAKVQFSPVLPPFLENREPNREF